ncbi:hypothetical protein RD110_14650 [Rhodoferax koreense]|uniref:Sensory/regulatory protein RpfC n=1 Tax=Rhodoferax koreensis TaxID=1842727 RepID=A0A1P8JX14_9BURK|nr:hypothetical protein RD110_14650 [Rhodoferax koreense]
MIILALAFLQRSQSEVFTSNLTKVRDFRAARIELGSSLLRLGWNAPSPGAITDGAEGAGVLQALSRIEDSLRRFDADPDGMTRLVEMRVDELRRELPIGNAAASAIDAVQLKTGYVALEQAMGRLDSYNSGQLRALMDRQKLQSNLGVGAALVLLASVGIFVLRNHGRLNRVESDLRESENQLRQMVELMPQMVWSCDAQGQCDYLSSRWAGFAGSPVEHYLGEGWLELIHPDDRDRVYQYWKAIVAAGSNSQQEFRLRRHDGVYRWFDVRGGLVFDVNGQPYKWFGSCTDITERKMFETELTQHRDKLEEEVEQRTAALVSALEERSKTQQRMHELIVKLREAEIFVRMVADNVPGRIAYWDQSMRCRFVNRRYAMWFGLAPEALVDRTMTEVRGAEYFDRYEARIRAALAGESQDYEREEYSVDGEHAVTRVQYLPDLRDGQVLGFFVLTTDITRHKHAEQLLQLSNQQLAEARDRADSANRAKSNFLANMSHEIRTPMNAILGLTHLLRRDIQDPTHQARLAKVSSVANHLLQVINDILDLSKIEAGKLSLENVDFSLDALLTRTCSMVLDVAREKGLEVVLDTGHIPDRLNGDPTRLMQALLNVLSNAVKFTERGSVLLRAELLSQEDTSLLIRFEVRDTGIGIDPAMLPLLFTPFVQADGSSTRRHGGTGLGLTITRHIAELMEGQAGGESLPGKGSRFWISVRLRPAQQAQAQAAPVLKGLRCLLVDDLPDARAAMAEMLRGLGLRTDVAGSGEEALHLVGAARAADDPYAVVVLDWAMPGMDGIETARRLQADAPLAPALVLVSAQDRDELQQQARDAGFGAVLLKPVTPSMLLDGLMRLLKSDAQAPAALRSVEAMEALLRQTHRGARVLLAEDNPVNQEVAADLLQAAGLVVDIAGDGEQAVRMARRGRYDLVLMDVQMPRMDGLEATRRLRQNPMMVDLPIIAMTANAFVEDRQACLDAGMNEHLAKPVDPRVLHEVLLRWLPLRPRLAPAVAPPDAAAAEIGPEQMLAGIRGLDLAVTYEQCANKPALAVRVLRQFLGHYRNTGAALMDYLHAGELEEPRKKLHSLRGAAGAVGAVKVLDGVVKTQAAMKAEAPLAELLPLAQALSDDLDALIAELAARLEA